MICSLSKKSGKAKDHRKKITGVVGGKQNDWRSRSSNRRPMGGCAQYVGKTGTCSKNYAIDLIETVQHGERWIDMSYANIYNSIFL